MEITYDMIYPLLADVQEQGSTVRATFKCPVTGQTVQSSAGMRQGRGVGSQVSSRVKRSLWWSLRNAIARIIRSAFGYGMAGRVAADAAYGAADGVAQSRQQSFSEAEKKQAIVDAFHSVEAQFAWEPAQKRFISAQAAGNVLPGFVLQLQNHPVTARYDQGVMARMLTEVARADGVLGDEERAFVANMVDPSIGTIDQLEKYAPLTQAELGETMAGPTRETMLMVAWAVSFCDEELAGQEMERLNQYAAGLGIAQEKVSELVKHAQLYAVDQALPAVYDDGKRDGDTYANILAMAQRIGLDPSEVERADIRYRKRYGLM